MALQYTPPMPLNAHPSGTRVVKPLQTYREPSAFEIFNACVNDLTGKDKLAKLTQYGIRLIGAVHDIHGFGNSRVKEKYRNLELVDNAVKNGDSPISNGSQLRLILSQTATVFKGHRLKRLLYLFLAYLTRKLAGLLNGLNIYRHLLRAGTVPFRVWKFANHIKHSIKILLDESKSDGQAVKLEKVLQYWTTRDMVSQMCNFWYALSDEILLIFRFGLLLRGKQGGFGFADALFSWAEDHELYSWMALIILGLQKDWNKWLHLKNEESRIILNQKVKARTRRIVGDMQRQRGNKLGSPDVDFEDYERVEEEFEYDHGYFSRLAKINHDKTTILINSVRLTCDLLFDAKYIMHWNMYRPLHVALGLASGTLGFVNCWRGQRERLVAEALAKMREQ